MPIKAATETTNLIAARVKVGTDVGAKACATTFSLGHGGCLQRIRRVLS